MSEPTMKVLDVKTRTVLEVSAGYGARLIEQGKAVIPPQGEPEKADARPDTGKPSPRKRSR